MIVNDIKVCEIILTFQFINYVGLDSFSASVIAL